MEHLMVDNKRDEMERDVGRIESAVNPDEFTFLAIGAKDHARTWFRGSASAPGDMQVNLPLKIEVIDMIKDLFEVIMFTLMVQNLTYSSFLPGRT